MIPILFICVGFIIAILWVDLKFDWLAVPYRGKPGILPEDVLAPMTYFYRYVTGKPIVLGTMFLLVLLTLILEIAQASVPAWVAWTSLVLFAVAVVRSTILVIPSARRFGRRTDTLEEQTRLAHALLGMHLFAFVLVVLMGAIQLYATASMQMNMVVFIALGFVAGIVWINVKFDWLAVPYRGKPELLPEEVLAPITLFHRYLRSAVQLALAMVIILISLILEIALNSVPSWVAWVSLVLFGVTMFRAILLVIPSGRRLATRVDSLEKQTSLAHALLPMHLFALGVTVILGGLQLYGYM